MRRQRVLAALATALAMWTSGCIAAPDAHAALDSARLRFEISFPASVRAQPVTGRLFLMISRKNDPDVRLQVGSYDTPPLFGLDVEALRPGESAVVDKHVAGYPLRSLRDLPAGDYYVQALLNVYTEFHRSDGHVIWAHMDQWEGQQFNISPGNLHSRTQRMRIDPAQSAAIKLSLTEVIPAVTVPADTPWVRRVKIQSKLLTRFWGRPVYLGAVVLLPRDYAANPGKRYPVIYQQGHFNLRPPFAFTTEKVEETDEQRKLRENLGYETGYEFYQAWSAENFPRMIAVTFQHPTPYYDNSFAMNSANTGPYGDAIVTELIPYIEKQFRAIAAPHGRLLTGGSAGGLESLALQLHYADFFGGMWSFCPAEIDFRRYYSIDVYEDENAYLFAPADIIGRSFYQEWRPTERILFRTVEGQPGVTVRQLRELESVLGSRGRGALWFDPSEATYGPVGREGYPTHFFDPQTGRIDRTVADHWRNYDLRDYAEKNLPRLGPLLKGKLHFYVGDMDEYFGNLDVLLFEDFVKKTAGPDYPAIFMYGRPGKGHMWTPMTHAQLVRTMAEHVARKGESQAEHMLTQGDRAAIDALLASQQKAWNEGNLPGFLEAYAHSDALTFFGSHGASKGWTAVRDQYEKGCRNCRSRGTLVLSTFDMRSLGPDSAMVLGHWSLQREQGKVGGVFTLVLGRFAEGWRIIHDHTSGVPSAQSQ